MPGVTGRASRYQKQGKHRTLAYPKGYRVRKNTRTGADTIPRSDFENKETKVEKHRTDCVNV
eukprot:640347-Amphidinium_carterae.4